MHNLTIGEVVKATGGKLLKGNENAVFSKIGKDSRAVEDNMLYVAIKGERFDGNDYAVASLEGGAMGCLVSREIEGEGNIILVEDTVKALGQLASYYRQKFSIPFIGVTGSVGKTTTKDMIACVLAAKYKTHSTLKNHNNHIGLPFTLFELNNSDEISVIEMGMSGFGEIDYLASLVKPQTAVLTNIGLSHIENLGSRENILKAKCEMLNHLDKNGFVLLCGDDDMLLSLDGELEFEHKYYGIENQNCDIVAKNIIQDKFSTKFEICCDGKSYEAEIPVLGEHNVKNALCAFGVGIHYNIEPETVIKALRSFVPGPMRQNIIPSEGMTIINDCYNSSPSSVEAGLKTLRQVGGKRKIAVLGDMLEMGDLSRELHLLCGKYVVESKTDFLVCVGDKSRFIAEGAIKEGFDKENTRFFETNKEVNDFLDTFLKKDDVVLVKASRGMKLEEIVNHITDFEDNKE